MVQFSSVCIKHYKVKSCSSNFLAVMIFCDGFNYAGNKTKNNAAFCDCWSFGLCNSTFHVMTLTAFFKYDAEENFDDHWAIAFTAAIIKFDQKCLLTLRSPFCYSPFVLYFYTTELNQGSSPNAKWFILSIKSPS